MSNANRFTPEEKVEMRKQLAELHKLFYEGQPASPAARVLEEIKRREQEKKGVANAT